MSAHSECINCGTTFKCRSKSFARRSIQYKLQAVDKTIKDVIEDQYNVSLTPEQKCTRFLCTPCTSTLTSIAKSVESKKQFDDAAGPSTYLKRKINTAGVVSTKLRTPVATPRKVKRHKVNQSTSSQQAPVHGEVRSYTNVNKTAPNTDVTRAFSYINRRQYRRAIRLLLRSKVGFKNAMADCIQDVVRKEVSDFVKKESTFAGGKTLEEMAGFNWNTVYEELKYNCPALTNVLVGTLTTQRSSKYLGMASRTSTSAKPTVGAVASIIMYTRKRTLNTFQEMNSLQMWLSSAKRDLFSRFNHVGLCTGIKATRSSIDRIRKTYDDEVYGMKTAAADYLCGMTGSQTMDDTIPFGGASESDVTDVDSDVTMDTPRGSPVPIETDSRDLTGSTSSRSELHTGAAAFSICFDNVNTKVTVRHQCKDKTNKMFNMVQGYAAQDRVDSLHLPDASPSPADIREIPLSVYFPSNLDEVTLRSEMTTMITRIIAKHITAFHDAHEVNQHLLHRYSKESGRKSIMIPLGVMDKDEAKVADMIDIMDEYHKYVPLKPTGEPLTIPLHADGLSCERGNDSQNARINAADPWHQLQGLILNPQEWHKRCTLLQDVYDELYGTGAREKGTLVYLKNFFNHRNVTTNVKQSFNHNEEFLDFCGDGYVALAACHFLNIRDVTQIPKEFPSDGDDIMTLLDSTASKIMDIVFQTCQPTVRSILEPTDDIEDCDEYPYCICRTNVPSQVMVFCENRNCTRGQWFHIDCIGMSEDDIPDGKWFCSERCTNEAVKRVKRVRKKSVADHLADKKQTYVLVAMWRSLNQKVRRDAIRENDGDRMILHCKFDMLEFAGHHHPKYFLLGQRLLAAMNGSVSPRLKHTLMWNRTVNPQGGPGKNIAMDLQMEFYNKRYKESVKDAAGQLTETTIARHSQMIGVGNVLRDVYAAQVSGITNSNIHTRTEFKRNKDIAEFVKVLTREDFFVPKPGRAFTSYPDIGMHLHHGVNPNSIRRRLLKHTKERSERQAIINMMQMQGYD